MKVFAVTIALSAIFFLALARPQDPPTEEAPPSGGGSGGNPPPQTNPVCQQYQQQCNGTANPGGVAGPATGMVPGGVVPVGDVAGGATNCTQLQQQCENPSGNPSLPVQPPVAVPDVGGGLPTNGTMPNMPVNGTMPAVPPVNGTMPAVPPVGGLPTNGSMPVEMPAVPGGLPIGG